MLQAHADQLMIFNGLDATTGGYLTQTTRTELIHVAQAAMGAVSGEQQSALRFRDSQKDSAAIDADQRDLTQTAGGCCSRATAIRASAPRLRHCSICAAPKRAHATVN